MLKLPDFYGENHLSSQMRPTVLHTQELRPYLGSNDLLRHCRLRGFGGPNLILWSQQVLGYGGSKSPERS